MMMMIRWAEYNLELFIYFSIIFKLKLKSYNKGSISVHDSYDRSVPLVNFICTLEKMTGCDRSATNSLKSLICAT